MAKNGCQPTHRERVEERRSVPREGQGRPWVAGAEAPLCPPLGRVVPPLKPLSGGLGHGWVIPTLAHPWMGGKDFVG